MRSNFKFSSQFIFLCKLRVVRRTYVLKRGVLLFFGFSLHINDEYVCTTWDTWTHATRRADVAQLSSWFSSAPWDVLKKVRFQRRRRAVRAIIILRSSIEESGDLLSWMFMTVNEWTTVCLMCTSCTGYVCTTFVPSLTSIPVCFCAPGTHEFPYHPHSIRNDTRYHLLQGTWLDIYVRQ